MKENPATAMSLILTAAVCLSCAALLSGLALLTSTAIEASSSTYTLALLGICIGILYSLYCKYDRLRQVPGYIAIPVPLIMSALRDNGRQFYPQLAQLGRQFNGLFRMGIKGVIVDKPDVADIILLQQMGKFANRHIPNSLINNICTGSMLTHDYDRRLQACRKAAHTAMHSYGTGLQQFEAIVQEEVVEMLEELQLQEGTDFAPTDLVYRTIINIMTTQILGQRFSAMSEEVQLVLKCDKSFREFLDIRSKLDVYTFPWLLNLPLGRYRRIRKWIEEAQELKEVLFQKFVIENKDAYSADHSPACVFTSLLQTQKTLGAAEFSDDMIHCIMLDLIIAANITTSSALTGILFILVNEQAVQERVYSEIKRVIGDGRMPTVRNRDEMPYTCAVIMECLRYQSVIALTPPRLSNADTNVSGYFIPKGTLVLVNLWAIHHSPENWTKPNEFYPEHFLDVDGNLLLLDQIKGKGFAPFGAGCRGCIGQVFAKNRLFVMLTSILQRFQICAPEASPLPENTLRNFVNEGMVMPPPFEARFKTRAVKIGE